MDSKTEYKKLKNLHRTVEETLEKYPYTRNSDTVLTWRIIKSYYPNEAMQDDRGKHWISFEGINLVREDRVKRARAKIQNEEGKYLPTDPEVRKARKITEEAYYEYCRKDNPALG